MFLQTLLAATTLLLARTTAQKISAAIVTIEASHGGAGQDLTNLTVTIPLTNTYTNASALDAVSTLYLVDTRGVPLNSVSCTPFKYKNGTGKGGLTFDSTTPSYLSTNTVQVGSIVCISTDISMAPPGAPGASSSSSSALAVASSSSATSKGKSTLVKTKTSMTHAVPTGQSQTQTQTQTIATATAAQSTQSPSASPTVPPSTGKAASIGLSSELFGGLAIAGFGIAFAL